MPVPAEGEILVRARYLSLDPYMRGRMNATKSYANAKPIEIGEPMEGESVAEVLKSRHPDYRPGELVQVRSGWRTHAAVRVVRSGNLAQQSAQPGGALIAESGCEPRLRLAPTQARGSQSFDAGVRQSQFLAAAVRAPLLDAHEAIAFERQDVPPKRGAVHHELIGQHIDRHRPWPLQFRKNRELCRAQARRREVLIVKLGDVPRGLTDGQAGALFELRFKVF